MNLPDNITLQATLEKSEEDKRPSRIAQGFAWLGRLALLLAVVLSPWMIASVDPLPQFWISVALLVALGVYWFESALDRQGKQVFPYVAVLVLLGLVIGLFQITPLPAALVETIGGRQMEIYRQYSVDASSILDGSNQQLGTGRLTLDRQGTLNQLRLLIMALGGLLLGCRLFKTRRDLTVMLTVITVNGVLISFFGFIQNLTYNGRLFWTIELTQGGEPFGPFVNRNNAAGYLLMCLAASIGLMTLVMAKKRTVGPRPMVSREIPPWRQFYFHFLFFIAELTAVKVASIIAAVVIASGVVATLSRGGVIAMLIGGLATLLIYGLARRPKHTGFVLIPVVALIIGLSTWIGFGSQFVDRMSEIDVENFQEEYRVKNWQDTWPAAFDMGLLGSGLGSYEKVHRLYRSDEEKKLFVYAENQYFQALIEGGWFALVIYLLAWGLCFRYAGILLYRGSSPPTIAIGVLAMFLLTSQAVASFFDFGFYIPANLLLMSVLVGFLAHHAHALANRLKKKTLLRFQVSNYAVQILLLLLFAATTMVCLDLDRRHSIDQALTHEIHDVDFKSLDLTETEAAIKEMSPLVRKTASVDGMNYLAGLWVHRCRLQFWDLWTRDPSVLSFSGDEREQMLDTLWGFTHLSRLHENLNYLKENESQARARSFVGFDFVRENLQHAYGYYALSRQTSPLQPFVHLQSGRINALFGLSENMSVDLERAVELSPANVKTRIAVATLYLQDRQPEKSTSHFRRALELSPDKFEQITNLITGRLNRNVARIPDRTVYDDVLPENPRMLHLFAVQYLPADSELRLEILEKADELLADISLSKQDLVLLSANVKLAKGDLTGGLERLNDALISEPNDRRTRYRLGKLYLENGMLFEAMEHAEYLAKLDGRDRRYQQLYEDVSEAVKNSRSRKPDEPSERE